MSLIKKILCPVDFSACSQEALRYAAHFADEMAHAQMDVLHAYQYATQIRSDLTAWINPGQADSIRAGAEEQAKAATDGFLAQLDNDTRSHISAVYVQFGEATDEIVRFATENRYDLIVMGTHGYTGLRHLVLGGVTDQVVRHSPVPVLTVRESAEGEAEGTGEEPTEPKPG